MSGCSWAAPSTAWVLASSCGMAPWYVYVTQNRQIKFDDVEIRNVQGFDWHILLKPTWQNRKLYYDPLHSSREVGEPLLWRHTPFTSIQFESIWIRERGNRTNCSIQNVASVDIYCCSSPMRMDNSSSLDCKSCCSRTRKPISVQSARQTIVVQVGIQRRGRSACSIQV